MRLVRSLYLNIFTFNILFIAIGFQSFASNPKVELHWNICDHSSESTIIQKLNFKLSKSSLRTVEYIDIPIELNFLQNGISVRIRKENDSWESTLKIKQPLNFNIDNNYILNSKEDSKCEYDKIGDIKVLNCSYSSQENKNNYPLNIYEALNEEQMRILKLKLPYFNNFDLLRGTGQIRQENFSLVYDKDNSFDLEITRLDQNSPDENLIQLSLKTSNDKSEQTYLKWLNYLKRANIQLCSTQKSKTQIILENYLSP